MGFMNERLSFASDYMEGAHPEILQRLAQTNLEQTAGLRPRHILRCGAGKDPCGMPGTACGGTLPHGRHTDEPDGDLGAPAPL